MKLTQAAYLNVGAYIVLLILGAVQGAIGSFQYSDLSPVGAILFCAAIFVTCLLAGWGMGSVSSSFDARKTTSHDSRSRRRTWTLAW